MPYSSSPSLAADSHISSFASGGVVMLGDRWNTGGTSSVALVMIQVLAYILTLRDKHVHDTMKDGSYRSMQVPGNLAPTLLAMKPHLSNTGMYHGVRPAERSITRPPGFNARLRAWICVRASSPLGSNQSMLSITTAIVKVPLAMRLITSLISSVWIRRPSKAPGRESFACALAVRYGGWHLHIKSV